VPSANGALTITKSGSSTATPVVPGTTLIQSGDLVTWTPAAGAVGPTTAFSVVAYDVQNAASAPQLKQSAPPVDVVVNQVDIAPKLTSVGLLSTASDNDPFYIPFDYFLGKTDAQAVAGHAVSFKITSVDSGTLQIQSGASAPVTVTFSGGLSTQTFKAGSTLI